MLQMRVARTMLQMPVAGTSVTVMLHIHVAGTMSRMHVASIDVTDACC